MSHRVWHVKALRLEWWKTHTMFGAATYTLRCRFLRWEPGIELTVYPKQPNEVTLEAPIKVTIERAAEHGGTITWSDVYLCISRQHETPQFASKRLHTPQGPCEYCEPCAEWALKIHETLGCHVHVERLEPIATLVDRIRAVAERLTSTKEG